MSAQREWQAHGLKIWETGSDGLERVIADFNQDKYKACRLAAAAPALLQALEAYVSHRPAFRSKPVGSPGSNARKEQEMEIKLEDAARAAIAKAR